MVRRKTLLREPLPAPQRLAYNLRTAGFLHVLWRPINRYVVELLDVWFKMENHAMLRRFQLALFLCGLSPLWIYSPARGEEVPSAETRTAQVLKTKSGIRYGIWPQKPDKPAPTLFIFGGSIEETLNSPYFRQSGNQLEKHGYLCVGIDLPGHGTEIRAGEPAGIDAWSVRCGKDEDFVAQATERFRAVLDELIELKLSDPARVAVCGTSRGGFMAVQFAASDERIKCVAAFAPVTDLMSLREFHGLKKRELAERLSLKPQAEKLAGRAVWLMIGDVDDRVSTDESIAFCRAVTSASRKQNKASLVDLHVVSEPKGHTTPTGAAELAATWIERQLGTAK
ncbi:MAG: esterase [Planctomycetaceae bacterium]|nr:esterase [Planctomycetaceae bacterium]